MNDDHIKLLQDKLQIPWVGSDTVPIRESVVVWTHPFFSAVRLRDDDSLTDDLQGLKKFHKYQLSSESDAFGTIAADTTTTSLIGIGVSLEALENAGTHGFRNMPLERYLQSRTLNPSGFFLTTTESGVPTDSQGHFRAAAEGYVLNTQRQRAVVQKHLVGAKHRYLTGSYADICMSHTLGDIAVGLPSLTILGHDSVFRVLTSKPNPNAPDVDMMREAKLVAGEFAERKKSLLDVQARAWIDLVNSIAPKTKLTVYDAPVNNLRGLPHHYQKSS